MKKIMISATVAVLAAAAATASAQTAAPHTQDIEEVLASILANSPEFQSLGQDAEAGKLQLKTENMLEDPTVEYSSFYSRGTTGQAGSELVVSQGFDFPTVYATRHKQNEFAKAAIESGLDAERRRILLDAKNVCFDIIMYRQNKKLLDMQAGIAEELLTLFEKRYATGDATSLELNKIKMERMKVATAVADNNASLNTANQSLTAMNGGMEIVFDADFYPLVEEVRDREAAVKEYLMSDAAILSAENATKAAKKQISLNRQNWIPKLEIGYRRNTAIREAEHGFLVGGSIPIFSNHRKVAMAKAQSAAAHGRLNVAKTQAEAAVKSVLAEIQETQTALKAYDQPLMQETLGLLNKAVEGGEISIIDYFVEASGIYDNLGNCIALQNRYHKLMAQLYINRL